MSSSFKKPEFKPEFKEECSFLTCLNCGSAFTTKRRYAYHITKQVCQRRKEFVSQTEESDENEGQSEIQGWKCFDCGSLFQRKWTLDRHRRQQICKLPTLMDASPQIFTDEYSNNENHPSAQALVPSKSEPLSESFDQIALLLKKMNDKLDKQDAKINEQDAKISEQVTKYQMSVLTKDKKSEEDVNKGDKEPKIDIVCLAKGDYIKKLIQLHDGDEEKAMNYIKNVGIASDFLEGDFRLIKKVYFDGKKKSQFPIRIKDYKRNKLEYLEENGEWILDIRGEIVGKRLCENIVSTLLIANTQFNEVIINEPDEDRKELLLDLFQINKTQAHIMRLLERKTQGKLSRRVAEFINYCQEVQAETGSLENVKKAY